MLNSDIRFEDLKPKDVVIFYYSFIKQINDIVRIYDTVDERYHKLIFGCIRKGLFYYVTNP